MRPGVPVRESPAGAIVDRVFSVLLVAAAVVFVWLLASIDPDARGHGTHERLGLPECAWPRVYGHPCPTCGVTTAATHLVHLAPIRSLTTQPFGFALALAGLLLAFLGARALVLGESFVARISLWPFGTITIVTIATFLAGWAWTWFTWP